ncbi:MAG: hypothetical protein KatS3mg115_1542 [Candidatus Poribacteria bacterium]|nr:MAG: hypothetical protein KatS3mg115_1542 [Candidatus Poribacteria bacterium]
MEREVVVVTGQNQVELQREEFDPTPGPEEVLIQTEYTYISTGTELANYTGQEPKVFQPGSWCAYPWRSGYANVGIVREVGSRVQRVSVGDRVFSYGNHASWVKYNTNRLIIRVPEGLDPGLAAASRMAGVAVTGPILAEIRSYPWTVVFGLGMVGNLAAQAFQLYGCRVIGVDPVERRRQVAQSCGVERVVGGTQQEVAETIREITRGRMGEITVDAVGHSAVVMEALRVTAQFGQLILLGSPRVAVEGNLTELLSDVHLRNITVRGGVGVVPADVPAGRRRGLSVLQARDDL